MKEALIKKAIQGTNSSVRLNLLREELHHLILQEFDRKGAFQDICFVGGTALRVLYQLDRFSEDLDFSTALQVRPAFSLDKLVRATQRSLTAYGIICELTPVKSSSAVLSCFLRFTGIVELVDRSFRKGQKLAIKIDVDTKPPKGAVETVTPVSGPRLYAIRHYDLASLFAGKLHAILYRQYTKGRDLYDFLWYCGSGARINLQLLENAAAQTEGKSVTFSEAGLRNSLKQRFRAINFARAREDLAPFVKDSASLSLFEEKIFIDAARRLQVA